MTKSPKILVIIPAYNEEGSICSVIREIRALKSDMDILVINDASTDETECLVAEMNEVVLTLPFNVGIGGAVQTGFKYAHENGYDVAVQVDGDGQHIPGQIPLLTEVLQTEADVVIGSRFIETLGYTTSWVRRIGVRIFMIVNSLILKQRITDSTSGFRAYNKKAIAFLASYYPHDYPEPESVVVLGRNGFCIREVPVKMREREYGRSSISAFHSVYYMIKVLLAIFVDLFREKIVH